MGAVHIDTQRKSREYDSKYPLDQPYGIRAVLTDYWRLKHAGDYEAVDVLAEFEQTVGRGGLTDKQAQALRLVFIEGYTQDEAAERLGLASKSGVNNLLQRGIDALATANGWGGEDMFAEWARAYFGENRLNNGEDTIK